MEQELKKAHDFLNNIIQSSPNAIMGTDMKGNIIIWNQGAEETLGYQASETIGRMNARDLYPGDIKVDSQIGEGTTFTISLPVHRPRD